MAKYKKEFSKLYDQYVKKIYRFAYLKVNSQDIAEDIASETFLRFYEKMKESAESKVKIDNQQAFLYRIASNLVIDHYREKGRTQFVSIENVPLVDPARGIDEITEISSDMDNIRLAMNNLSDDYQNIIIMHYLDDLSVRDVSLALDKSEQATRVQIHRALKALRKEVQES